MISADREYLLDAPLEPWLQSLRAAPCAGYHRNQFPSCACRSFASAVIHCSRGFSRLMRLPVSGTFMNLWRFQMIRPAY